MAESNKQVSRQEAHEASVHTNKNAPHAQPQELTAIADAIGVGVAVVQDDGKFVWANQTLCSMLGYSHISLSRLTLRNVIPDGDLLFGPRDITSEQARQTAERITRLRVTRQDGTLLDVRLTLSRVPASEQGHHVVTLCDLGELSRLEDTVAELELERAELVDSQRKDLVVWELNHRLRNVYPTILTLMRLMAERYPEALEYRRAIELRIRALADADDLIRRSESNYLSLRDLLSTELLPFREWADVTIDGPPVRLKGALAQGFVIVLHELATNAAKHGSLSVPNGRLLASWEIDPREGGVLRFSWIERGGPSVASVRQSGFGTTIIRQSGDLLGGTANVDYAPEGLMYRLSVPLTNLDLSHRT